MFECKTSSTYCTWVHRGRRSCNNCVFLFLWAPLHLNSGFSAMYSPQLQVKANILLPFSALKQLWCHMTLLYLALPCDEFPSRFILSDKNVSSLSDHIQYLPFPSSKIWCIKISYQGKFNTHLWVHGSRKLFLPGPPCTQRPWCGVWELDSSLCLALHPWEMLLGVFVCILQSVSLGRTSPLPLIRCVLMPLCLLALSLFLSGTLTAAHYAVSFL